MALSKIKTNSIEDAAITATQIATDAVDSAEIAADAVGTSEIAANAVAASELADDAVDTAAIADDAVTGAKVALFDDSLAATTTHFLIADGTDYSSFALSGDVTSSNAGAVTIADNAVSLTKLADGTQGGIVYYGASGSPTQLAVGTSGQFLSSGGAAANLSWATVDALPSQTSKDGYTLITDGTDASWVARSGRNIFINGACQVNQRGNATGQTGSAYHSVDRFYTAISAIGTYSFSQEADAPDGFASSWKIDCTTADASPAAGDLLVLQCKFEGYNLQQLKKGTASAESLTLSFWVKSYQTGNYQLNLIDEANTRCIGTTFTISTTATWEYKTMTFAGDTTGTIPNDNTDGLYFEIWFDSGTDFSGGAVPTSWEAKVNTDRNAGGTINLADSTSNYFQMTGIQLEVGTVATPFEHKSYGQELRECQRYYMLIGKGFSGMSITTTEFDFYAMWPEMRASPSVTLTTTTPQAQMNNYGVITGSGSSVTQSLADAQGTFGCRIDGFSLTAHRQSTLKTTCVKQDAEL